MSANDVLREYEKWEADLIESREAWGDRALPIFTQELWDGLLRIQKLRNRALYNLKGSDEI